MKNTPSAILAIFAPPSKSPRPAQVLTRNPAHTVTPTSSLPTPVVPGVAPHSPALVRNTDLPSGGGIKGARNY